MVQIKQGQVCVHPGNILHRGQEITKGTRYLLVGFLEDQRHKLADW